MAQAYENLVVWQKAVGMVTQIYNASKKFPREEAFGLTIQLRRSAISVASNIAEGRGRLSQKEFRQFLGTARGSLLEAETQLRIACNLQYLPQPRLMELLTISNEVGRALNGLIATLKESVH